MPTIKWKKNKNLKPGVILSKIDELKNVNEDGSISYDSFLYHDAFAALPTMIEFPTKLAGEKKETIISQALNAVAKVENLTPTNVLAEINRIVRQLSATKEIEYRMLTSMSLAAPFPRKVLAIENVRIHIFSGQYPKKYCGRTALISQFKHFVSDGPPTYAKVIASTKERSPERATSKILRALDLVRGIWCLFANDYMQIIGNEWEPINKVRLGGAHSLHYSGGKILEKHLNYEPNFIASKPFKSIHFKTFQDNSAWAIEKLSQSPYSMSLSESLLRYVRALDEKDQNTALIKLWGALETLAAPNENSYEKLTKRCSFIFEERDYHQQILEHIREARNQSIHAGDQSEKSKTLCFQLQYYFRKLLIFHLHNSIDFQDLQEANNFLDLPHSIEVLERRKTLIDKAISFAGH